MLLANRMLGPFCVSTTRKDRFASARPSMHCDTVTHSPDSPARKRGPIATEVDCRRRTTTQHPIDTARSMGPGVRRDDSEKRAPVETGARWMWTGKPEAYLSVRCLSA